MENLSQIKMNILIYSPYFSTMGGGEKYILSCAETLLKHGYKVTIAGAVELHKLEAYFNINLKKAKSLVVRHHREVSWYSQYYDLVIITTNYLYVEHRCKAIYILQVPFGRGWNGGLKGRVKNFIRRRTLRKLRKENVIVYSDFCRDSIRENWDIHATTIEPGINDFFSFLPKQKIILSVGRIFNGGYNEKRYDILIPAFRRFYETHLGWEYHILGSCNDIDYLLKMEKLAEGLPVYFHINATYADLKKFYGQAMIFWHGAGHGINEKIHPESMEHFGISTVEAMGAGCIPVVYHGGAQKEITKGVLTWTSVDQLLKQTNLAISSPSDKSKWALKRFGDFSQDRFSAEFIDYVEMI